MFNVGPLEIVIVVLIALLVIGPEELPATVRKVAAFLRELRQLGEEVQQEVMAIIEDTSVSEGGSEDAPDGQKRVGSIGNDGGEGVLAERSSSGGTTQ